MGRFARLGKNTLLISIGSIGSKLISFIMLPLYTRWLSVDEFGLTDIVQSYSGLLLSVFTCAITEAIFIFPKGESEATKKSMFSVGLVFLAISSFVFAFVFLGIGAVCEFKGISNAFSDNIWVIYSLLVASAFQSYFQQFTRSIDSLLVYSITGILHTVLIALFGFLLVPKNGVLGFFLSLILALWGSALFTLFASKSYKFLSLSSGRINDLKMMLSYSIPLIPNTVMWWLISALNRPIMENYVGLEGIGLYAIANKIPALLTMLFTVFASAWQISVLEEYGKPNYRVFYNSAFRIIITLIVIGVVLISWGSKVIIHIIATSEYYDAWRYIPLLSLAVFFSCVSSIVGSNFSAAKQSKYFFYSSVWGGGVTILANLILIPMYGTMGAVFSTLLSFFVMAIVRILYSWKYAPIEGLKYYIVFFVLAFAIAISIIIEINRYFVIAMTIVFFTYIIITNKEYWKTAKTLMTDCLKKKE